MKLSTQQVAGYTEHGDEAIAAMARQYLDLLSAVQRVYYSAVWTADRDVNEQEMWTELRDAAGFIPGNSPAPTELYEKMKELKNE